ncbi:alpha/beta fold hydrolase [Streptomyces sp. NPDC057539]|uniref:alpha/beta fold hydrolase n=1 Tax=Streptomyces sp. NPDC057539 TaxID=3346159 RepID=UPI00367720B7
MTGRHDAVPRVAGGLLAGAVLAGLVTQAMRHRRVVRGRGDESLFETGRRNILAYRLTEPQDSVPSDTPVLVFESAMVSTAEHWSWVRRSLGQQFPTLIYSRAGYGRSEFHSTEPFTLESAVRDLEELVRHVCGHRPVVLVGHSLGGYLALRSAESMRDLIRGLVLIDPSHPGELLRSSAQAKGAEQVTFGLVLMPQSTRLGLGGLLPEPSWVRLLPGDQQDLCNDQYRDEKLWTAAKREWRATHREFLNYDGNLPEFGVPVRLIAADRTHVTDKTASDLHGEIVAAATQGDMRVIERAKHDEILLNEELASQVSRLIHDFMHNLDGRHSAAKEVS